jgi:23S rRNA (pseudouridine1915-N3)-methyltransferase
VKVILACVGRPRGAVADLIADYERRVARYFRFEVAEVKETPKRGPAVEELLLDEADRLLARIPEHAELIALHRPGRPWSSETLAGHLAEGSLKSVPAIAFCIGGAFGLGSSLLERAHHRLSLSSMTLPHDLARLVLTEQLYRAGTISRGEPYHKAAGCR